MKRIFAIMNDDMVDPTKKLLSEIGINCIQVKNALGKGEARNLKNHPRNTSLKSDIAHYFLHDKGLITDAVLRRNKDLIKREMESGFHPKRMVIFTIHDYEVMIVIYKLMNMHAGWGKGKGKIFVCPVLD